MSKSRSAQTANEHFLAVIRPQLLKCDSQIDGFCQLNQILYNRFLAQLNHSTMDFTPSTEWQQKIFHSLDNFPFSCDERQQASVNPEILSLIYALSLKNPKKSGSFYTPADISQSLVRQIIDYFITEHGPEALLTIRILDPAAGSGNFLLMAFYELASRIKQPSLLAITNCLYGFDINPQALQIARQRLQLAVGQEDLSDYKNLIATDFLDQQLQQPFDIILGNPPWKTLTHKELGQQLPVWKEKFQSLSGFKFNLFPLFLEKSLSLLKAHGFLGALVPDRLLTNPSFRNIRQILLQWQILPVAHYPSGKFQNIVGGFIVLKIQKKPANHGKICIEDCELNLSKYLSRSQILQNPELKFAIHRSPRANSCLEIFYANSDSTLLNLFSVHVGMMIKNKKQSLHQSNGRHQIVEGKHIQHFQIKATLFFEPTTVQVFGGTRSPNKQCHSPKLFLRKTGNQLICALDRQGIYAEQSVYLLVPKAQVDLYYIMACLNSRLMTFFFRNELITNPQCYPYIQHYDVEQIPLKTQRQPAISGLAQLITTKLAQQKELKPMIWQLMDFCIYEHYLPQFFSKTCSILALAQSYLSDLDGRFPSEKIMETIEKMLKKPEIKLIESCSR